MARTGGILLLVTVFYGGIAVAQEGKQDEATIRGLIAGIDRGERVAVLDDNVFWSGAYQKPSIGKAEAPRRSNRGERDPATDRSVTTVVKLDVAKSGEMAWEYSNSQVTFTFKDGRKNTFARSILRVWRKDAGAWKVAAVFGLPHYLD